MDRISDRRWFVEVNGYASGPYLWDVLVQHARRGDFAPYHKVRAEDWADWLPATQVPGLFPASQLAITNDALTRALVPVGRSGMAIAAGYLGLLSVVPFVGPLALVAGVLALRGLKRDPKLHGAGRAWFGIVMGALFTLLYGLVFLAR